MSFPPGSWVQVRQGRAGHAAARGRYMTSEASAHGRRPRFSYPMGRVFQPSFASADSLHRASSRIGQNIAEARRRRMARRRPCHRLCLVIWGRIAVIVGENRVSVKLDRLALHIRLDVDDPSNPRCDDVLGAVVARYQRGLTSTFADPIQPYKFRMRSLNNQHICPSFGRNSQPRLGRDRSTRADDAAPVG